MVESRNTGEWGGRQGTYGRWEVKGREQKRAVVRERGAEEHEIERLKLLLEFNVLRGLSINFKS